MFGRAEKTATISMSYKSQADIAMGFRTVSRKSSEFYPFALGNLILGQIGLYGRLGKNVREEKVLAYYSFSSLVAKTHAGHIALYSGVNPKNVQAAIEGISDEIVRIQGEPIGEEELANGKRNAIGSLSISLDTSFERVGTIHEMEYYSLGGSRYFEEYEEKIDGVTAEDIRGEFSKYADASRIFMAVVGPLKEGEQLPQLENLLRSRKRNAA